MNVQREQVRDILRLERSRLTPEPNMTYRQIGVYSWGKGIIENEPVRGSDLSKVTYYRFPPKALILSNIQAWEAAIAVSTDHHARNFIASQRFLPYVPLDENQVDTAYLKHFFLSEPGMILIRRASPGTVTRNRTLGIKAFEDLTVPLPPIGQQRAIASKLDGLFGLSTQLQVVTAARETLERTLRERMIYGDLAPASTVDMKLGDILEETVETATVTEGKLYPTAGIRNRGRGLFSGPTLSTQSTKYRTLRRLHAGQVIYSKLKAFEGAISIVPEEYDGRFTSHEFPTFSVESELAESEYLRSAFMTERFTELLAGSSKGVGARRERLSPQAFLALPIPVPALAQQQRIVRHLQHLRQVNYLGKKQDEVAAALPQAARNEVFAKIA